MKIRKRQKHIYEKKKTKTKQNLHYKKEGDMIREGKKKVWRLLLSKW